MTELEQILDRPDSHVHFVQLYGNDDALAPNVGRYLSEGLDQGDSGIVIATPGHWSAFQQILESRGVDVPAAEGERKLLFLDAEQTLNRFMVGGVPDWNRFEKTISSSVGWLRCPPKHTVRAYGEMVGVLWTAGEYSAAIKLEEYWNQVLEVLGITLFCSYPIDIFSPEFESSGIHSILSDHTHLLPAYDAEALEAALTVSLREMLGDRADDFRSQLNATCRGAWGVVPTAQQMILWMRDNLPASADEILCRARGHYHPHSTPTSS